MLVRVAAAWVLKHAISSCDSYSSGNHAGFHIPDGQDKVNMKILEQSTMRWLKSLTGHIVGS